MIIYGYLRVSSTHQRDDMYVIYLRELGIKTQNIYIDRINGNASDRPNYMKMMNQLKPGDLLYILSLDQLGLTLDDIQNQWSILIKDIGIDISVIDMPLLDTRQYKDMLNSFVIDLIPQVLSFAAHYKTEYNRMRQAQGIAAARARGVHLGRPVMQMPEDFEEVVQEWLEGEISTSEAITRCGKSESTFYRRARELVKLHGQTKQPLKAK